MQVRTRTWKLFYKVGVFLILVIPVCSCNRDSGKQNFSLVEKQHFFLTADSKIVARIDSFISINNDVRILRFLFNRTFEKSNIILYPTNNKNYLKNETLPSTYEFYKNRLFLFYTGEEVVNNKQYSLVSLYQSWDSTCKANNVVSTDFETYCPSFLAISVDQATGNIVTMSMEMQNAFFGRIELPFFTPPAISDNK